MGFVAFGHNCDQITCQLSTLSLCVAAVGLAWPLTESPQNFLVGDYIFQNVLCDEGTFKSSVSFDVINDSRTGASASFRF
jgi:hypothetical protein